MSVSRLEMCPLNNQRNSCSVFHDCVGQSLRPLIKLSGSQTKLFYLLIFQFETRGWYITQCYHSCQYTKAQFTLQHYTQIHTDPDTHMHKIII